MLHFNKLKIMGIIMFLGLKSKTNYLTILSSSKRKRRYQYRVIQLSIFKYNLLMIGVKCQPSKFKVVSHPIKYLIHQIYRFQYKLII